MKSQTFDTSTWFCRPGNISHFEIFFGPWHIFPLERILTPNDILWSQKMYWSWGPKILGLQSTLDPKKNYGSKQILGQKNLGQRKLFIKKNSGSRKKFGQNTKNFGSQKNLTSPPPCVSPSSLCIFIPPPPFMVSLNNVVQVACTNCTKHNYSIQNIIT